MRRCHAQTKSGARCLNLAKHGNFCTAHRSQNGTEDTLAMAAGALVGAVLAPGLGPALLGALAGKVMKDLSEEDTVTKKRVFVSFDFDHDHALKHLIIGQTRLPDLDFDVVDHSLKEAAPERDWVDKARRAIGRSDLVLVMVGSRTHSAQGVLKEVRMAREMGIKVAQIIGYKEGSYTPVPDAGRLYSWSHENLRTLLS